MRLFLLFLICLVNVGCTSLFYHPIKEDLIDVQKLTTQPENITLTTTDQKHLHGWYFKNTLHPNHPYAEILFFHGNSQNITTHFNALYWVLKFGYDFFIFDYEGFGESEGSPNPAATTRDGKAALNWISQNGPAVPLVVFGQSLGGAIALRVCGELNKQIPIRLLIVDSTFESYQTMGSSVLARFWLTWPFQPLSYILINNSEAPAPWIPQIAPLPLTVIHGTDDHVVEFEHSEKVFQLAKDPKQFWQIPNGHHADMMYRDGGKYAKQFLDYIDTELNVHRPPD